MTNQQQIVECVPNFSEGRNMHVIKQITDEIERVKGVKLLDETQVKLPIERW